MRHTGKYTGSTGRRDSGPGGAIDSNAAIRLEYRVCRTNDPSGRREKDERKRKKQFLEAVAENPAVVQHVKLFRMPLFLTVLDEEFGKCDESVWETESSVKEAAFEVMPMTLQQFSVPQEEIDGVISQCVAEYAKK